MFKSIWSAITGVFKKINFKDVLKRIFQSALVVLLDSVWDIALKVVQEVDSSDLTNSEKRQEAFNKIKEIVVAEGIEIKDSLIGLLLEIAVTFIKNS